MKKFKAFIFDLNGTMIYDMPFHTKAWHSIVSGDLKANLTEQQVTKEMYGKNEELLIRIFGPEKFTPQEMQQISDEKENRYRAAFKPHLKLIEGLQQFLQNAARAGIKMAIGSAAVPANINFILDNTGTREFFSAIVSANDVAESKPHPDTFLKAAAALQVNPEDCLVFEDAPKGVESAANAKMKTVVLLGEHQQQDFTAYNNILWFIKNYTDQVLGQLL